MRGTLVTCSLAAVALLAGGCAPFEYACTENLVFGLSITVKADDGTRICSAKVTAIDGAYREELQTFPGPECVFVGAGERPGKYRIEVERRGFEKAALNDVEVTSDTCHVTAQTREIQLIEMPGCDGLDTAGITAIVHKPSGARACDANVRAAKQDANNPTPFYETFDPINDLDGGCGYRGAIDQVGTFDVLINATGSPDIHRAVTVTEDSCRMQSQRVDVVLE